MAILQPQVDNDDNYEIKRPTTELQLILKYIEKIEQNQPLIVFEKIVNMLGMLKFSIQI